MNFMQNTDQKIQRVTGLIIVVLVHLFLMYILARGITQDIVKVVQPPIEMKIIQEVKITKPIIETAMTPTKPQPIKQPEKKIEPKALDQPKPKAIEEPPNKIRSPPTAVEPELPMKSIATTPSIPIAEAKKVQGETRGVSGSASANCPTPVYPQDALLNEEHGRVRLRLDVASNGRVVQAKVTQSSGSKTLDRAATTAYKQCVFSAALQNGAAVVGSIDLEYEFKLD